MYFPKPSLLPTLIREIFSKRNLMREPESALVMVDSQEVKAYVDGTKNNNLAATFLFINSHASQVIHGRRRVLDLGCGPATILCQLALTHPSIHFVGVDLSDTMLAEGRKRIKELGLENVTLVRDDITQLQAFHDKEFDGVVSTFALHHLPTRQHFDDCLKQIARVLEPDGAIFLFDFGRLKNVSSVIQMAYLNSQEDPYIFTLDKERSMRAAFTFEEFQNATKQFLPARCEVYSTAQVPLFVMVRTQPRPISQSMENYFKDQRRKLLPKYQHVLDDLRFFFSLGGLRNDLFDPLIPVVGQLAKLRMLDVSTLPVLPYIQSSLISRFWGVFCLGFKISSAYALYGINKKLNPTQHNQYEQKLYEDIANFIKSDMGILKGPIMKFGQMASYLTENIPPKIRDVLKPLQHSSRPIDGKDIRKFVEKELRAPIEKLFTEWDDTPIAAASISQLHLARLHSGQLVVVKVRYPNIIPAIRCDFFLLQVLAPVLSKAWGLSNIRYLINELEALILAECDFIKAGAYQEEFRHIFRDDFEIVIPKVYRDYSSASVLTMDYVEGQSYDEFKQSATQDEKNKAAIIIWRMAAISINRKIFSGVYGALETTILGRL